MDSVEILKIYIYGGVFLMQLVCGLLSRSFLKRGNPKRILFFILGYFLTIPGMIICLFGSDSANKRGKPSELLALKKLLENGDISQEVYDDEKKKLGY